MSRARRSFPPALLDSLRAMTVQETLDRLGLYWKRDPDFVPVKDAATVRLNVSIGGGGVELLATGPKWYDTRKEQGGGAIDLTICRGRLRKRKIKHAKKVTRFSTAFADPSTADKEERDRKAIVFRSLRRMFSRLSCYPI
jgi:hypothetical protein